MEALHDDLLEVILLKLPITTLATSCEVSKKWRNVIRSKPFIKEYTGRSTTKPQLLIVETTTKSELLFHSMYQEPNTEEIVVKEKPVFTQHRGPLFHVDNPVRGLVCISYNRTKVVIANPGAKKLMRLPESQAGRTKCLLGYDEDTDVFKVLCVPEVRTREEAMEYQVLTVGSDGESWRGIECNHHHTRVTNGICKGGVVYFATLSQEIVLLMSFDVRSEKITVVIELPKGATIHDASSFVNYNGTIALVDETRDEPNGDGVLEIWVMNETETTWNKCTILLPGWDKILKFSTFFFKGAIATTGELLFAPTIRNHGYVFLLYYNPATRQYKCPQISGEDDGCFYTDVLPFLDHVDTPFLL